VIARFNLQPFGAPAYRRYFVASAMASGALWIYQPSMEWTILGQTGRAGAVGLVQTTLIVALTLSTLPGGALCDRFGPKAVQVFSLLGLAAITGLVAVVANLGALTLETALLLTFALGIFDGLWSVSAWLILPLSVASAILGSAIGLTYLTGGIGRLVGGPLGGAVLQTAGTVAFVPASVLLLGAALVMATVTGLLLPADDRRHGVAHGEVDPVPPPAPAASTAPAVPADAHAPTGAPAAERPAVAATPGVGLRSAVRWTLTEPGVAGVAFLSLLAAATISTYATLWPILTRDVLGAGAATLGLLSGASGIGVVVGSLTLEAVGRRVRRGVLVVAGFTTSAVLVGLLGIAHVLPAALALVAGITFLTIGFSGTTQLLLYTLPPARLRARVVSLFTFAGYVVLPVATTVVTQLADRVGVSAVLIGIAAVAVAGVALVLLFRRSILSIDVDRDGRPIRAGTPAEGQAPAAARDSVNTPSA
jgi:hypothetical protein